MSDYTPSVAEFRDWIDSIVKGQRTGARDPGPVIAEFNRMIEAVRAEEREKAAQIAEEFDPVEAALAGRYAGKDIATRIREQGS